MSYLGDCARVYAPTGRISHLLAPGIPPSGDDEALCRQRPNTTWQGTGSQGEYEKAAALPLCSRCRHLAVSR